MTQVRVRKRWLLLGVALLIALGSLIGVGAVMQKPIEGTGDYGQAEIGGNFRLTDQHGNRVSNTDLHGRYALIYFGYTFCPDICPMTLANMMAAIEALPEDPAEQVVPVFITVDPARDTVEQLAEYAPLFGDRLVALTGTDAEIKAAARAYKVYFSKASDAAAGGDYAVDHSGFVYLMGPDGGYRSHFSHETPPDEMARRLRQAIEAAPVG